TSVITTMSNIGPGLEVVGPAGNFAAFSPLSKLVLSFCMLAGRLEIYPMLIMFSPSIWRKNH
ncbi:MAG: potassium transporter TrkG, partial [Clostridium butyricum]|nr:potassium transporter TrkG [Clostridium butyricum]